MKTKFVKMLVFLIFLFCMLDIVCLDTEHSHYSLGKKTTNVVLEKGRISDVCPKNFRSSLLRLLLKIKGNSI